MDTYILAVSIAIPIFILLIIIEAVAAYKMGIIINSSADMISSLSSGITNTARDAIKFGFVLISYEWLINHITIIKLEPVWFAIIIACLIQDFAGYWMHRLNHRVNIFWNRHIIHHSSEEFNLSCALRQSISDNIKFSALLLLPAAILGIPSSIFVIIGPIHLFMQFWYHTRLIDKMGVLEKILVTPSHHRVHHAINPEYIDKNYSQIFIIWDKIFGTFQAEEQSITPIYGVLRPVKTWNPIVINFKHFWQIALDAYHTKNLIHKITIWFMPTGWRPSDINNMYPINNINNPYNYKKYSKKNSNQLISWAWIQFFLSGIILYFIFFLIIFSNDINYSSMIINLICIILFIHIMSYTFLLDHNKLSILMELFKFIITLSMFIMLHRLGNEIYTSITLIIVAYLFISLLLTIYLYNNSRNKHA